MSEVGSLQKHLGATVGARLVGEAVGAAEPVQQAPTRLRDVPRHNEIGVSAIHNGGDNVDGSVTSVAVTGVPSGYVAPSYMQQHCSLTVGTGVGAVVTQTPEYLAQTARVSCKVRSPEARMIRQVQLADVVVAPGAVGAREVGAVPTTHEAPIALEHKSVGMRGIQLAADAPAGVQQQRATTGGPHVPRTLVPRQVLFKTPERHLSEGAAFCP